ncbi:MAG: hypothetical protein ACOCWG_00245 [bacterium]
MKKRILVKDVLDLYNEADALYQKVIEKMQYKSFDEFHSFFHRKMVEQHQRLKETIEDFKDSKYGVLGNNYYNPHTKAKFFLPIVKRHSELLKYRCYTLVPSLERKEKLNKLMNIKKK